MALVGRGQIYQVILKAGEEFVVHPGSLLAHSVSASFYPVPYRLHSSTIRFQVPRLDLGKLLPNFEFVRIIRNLGAYKAVAKALFGIWTWARHTIWGDRVTRVLSSTNPSVYVLTHGYSFSCGSKALGQCCYSQGQHRYRTF